MTDPRAARRAQRRLDIQEQACLLVLERGYDGFTMDELATAVGVSRRTLFNYVADKASAVLGGETPEELAGCGAQGLLDGACGPDVQSDILTVIRAMLRRPEVADATALERHHLVERAVASDPKLAALAAHHHDELMRLLVEAICAREGWGLEDLRARVLASRVMGLVTVMLDEVSHSRGRVCFADAFEAVLAADAGVFGAGAFDADRVGAG